MKKKILLIIPGSTAIAYSDMGNEVGSLTNKPGGLMNAGLATVAALTPKDFEVRIIDENIEGINFDESCDLVGITGFINQLVRAEEIAKEFSKRGIPIVCGGISATFRPEKWRPFADVLIRGEAERIWPQFLKDFLTGSYKKEYHETERFDLSISPVPDYSGFSKKALKKYLGGIVQTSRGCPFNCEFCQVIIFLGRKMRYKPVENIIQEVEQHYTAAGKRIILLADDNFAGNRDEAKKIMRALAVWNSKKSQPVSFITQLSIDVARDEEFLELASAAGFILVFVGIETPNIDSLKETSKNQNTTHSIPEDIKKFHQHGIMVLGGCMVGFDNDDLSIFQKQFDFFMQTGVSSIHIYPVQALDGTRLMKRMVKEGRYVDWEESARANPDMANQLNSFTIVPKQMTIDQLKKGVSWLFWQLYKPDNFIERCRLFFEDFEGSPKKEKLAIPKGRLDLERVKIGVNLVKYLLFNANKAERNVFWQLFDFIRRSTHPQRLVMLVWNFLKFKNTHQIYSRDLAETDQICYPRKDSKVFNPL